MKLALMTTTRCNAACSHCSTSCGPHRTEQLSREKILALMDEAAALSQGEPLKFGFTGGEPFLDFDLLLEIVAHGRKLGAVEITCQTNAYWATSPEKARALLTQLKDAGLHRFGISASRFHQEFVKITRVETALAAARDVGLPVGLKYVRTKSQAGDDAEVELWARSCGAYRVEIYDVLPHLRDGVTFGDDEYERKPGLPSDPCPSSLITVREDGEAFTCAQPGSLTPFLSLGSTHGLPLEEIQDAFYFGARQQILRGEGPIHFARAVIARGEGARLRASYADVCDLCTHIVNDPVMSAIAAEAAQAFDQRQIDKLLETLDR